MHGFVYASIYIILYTVHIREHADMLELYHINYMLTCSVLAHVYVPIIPNMDILCDLYHQGFSFFR